MRLLYASALLAAVTACAADLRHQKEFVGKWTWVGMFFPDIREYLPTDDSTAFYSIYGSELL